MNSAEGRHEEMLWQPTRVIAVITSEDWEGDIEETVARQDDAFWHAFIRRPFTWHRYLLWFAARRWVRPRDIRKDEMR